MNRWRRGAVFVLLCGAVFGLGVYHDVADDAHEPYPTGEAIKTDYSAHVGERVLLFGTVTDETGATARIRVDTAAGPLSMRVVPFDAAVREGGVVQVYGTLAPDRTVRATNVAVVNPAGSSKLFKYGVSAIGAVVILV
ncbi:MAG: hypothetical protein ABEJ85_04475, partial [Haloarculaceae archaeon]